MPLEGCFHREPSPIDNSQQTGRGKDQEGARGNSSRETILNVNKKPLRPGLRYGNAAMPERRHRAVSFLSSAVVVNAKDNCGDI